MSKKIHSVRSMAPWAMLALWASAACGGESAAVEATLSVNDTHAVYTWDGAGALRVQWPLLMRHDGKEEKPTGKEIDREAKRAVLTYAEDMTMTVEPLPTGEFHCTLANARRDVKTLRIRTTLPKTYMENGGRWAVGDKEGAIPVEKAEKPHLFMGAGKQLILTPNQGLSLAFTPMPGTFMELTDNRHWGNNPIHMAMFNMPFRPEAATQTLRIACPADAEGASQPAPSAHKASVAPRVIPPAKPVDPGAGDGATVVARFKDGREGAFSLSFDDGCDSHLDNALPLLTKYRIPGTFFIFPDAGFFKKDRWAKAAAENEFLVLGNHTFQHKAMKTVEDIDFQFGECNKVIHALQPASASRMIAYARPGGMKPEEWKVTNEQLKDGMARHHLLPRDHFVDARMGVARVIDSAESALTRGRLAHVDYHGIGGDWLVVSSEDLEAVLRRLDELRDRLWLTDLASAMEYVRQRDAAEIDVAVDADTLRVTVKTPNDPAYYGRPLTLATRLPAAWKGRAATLRVTAADGAATEAAVTPRDDGVVFYDLIPNRQTAEFKAKP